jgi:hypothetical protein
MHVRDELVSYGHFDAANRSPLDSFFDRILLRRSRFGSR